MSYKVTRQTVAMGVLAAICLPAMICGLESLRYPRIARSAYWRHPAILLKATFARVFAGQGVRSREVLDHAATQNAKGPMTARLLYLPDWPRDDKSISDRVFCLIGKAPSPTREELFWFVNPAAHGSEICDDTLVYEYKTGRMVDMMH